jgi:hypothetical protein
MPAAWQAKREREAKKRKMPAEPIWEICSAGVAEGQYLRLSPDT